MVARGPENRLISIAGQRRAAIALQVSRAIGLFIRAAVFCWIFFHLDMSRISIAYGLLLVFLACVVVSAKDEVGLRLGSKSRIGSFIGMLWANPVEVIFAIMLLGRDEFELLQCYFTLALTVEPFVLVYMCFKESIRTSVIASAEASSSRVVYSRSALTVVTVVYALPYLIHQPNANYALLGHGAQVLLFSRLSAIFLLLLGTCYFWPGARAPRDPEERDDDITTSLMTPKIIPWLRLRTPIAHAIILLVGTLSLALVAHFLIRDVTLSTGSKQTSVQTRPLVLPFVSHVAYVHTVGPKTQALINTGKAPKGVARALDRSIQISLVLQPAAILAGWILGKPFEFSTLSVHPLFISITGWAAGRTLLNRRAQRSAFWGPFVSLAGFYVGCFVYARIALRWRAIPHSAAT